MDRANVVSENNFRGGSAMTAADIQRSSPNSRAL